MCGFQNLLKPDRDAAKFHLWFKNMNCVVEITNLLLNLPLEMMYN